MLSSEIDGRIIDLLVMDADLSYREIARKLRLNPSTVRKRVLSLKRRGVIRKVIVEVDTEKIGLKLNVSLGIDVDPTKSIEASKRLAGMPETVMGFHTSGGHDFYVIVHARDRESLTKIINKYRSIEGVAKVVPTFIMERLR